MGHSRLTLVLAVLAATSASGGCSQDPVSIGDQQPSTQLKTGLAAYAADWDGYVEAYQFSDGTDRVRIALSEDGSGTIRLGNQDLRPAATDPNAKYPPDYPNGGGVVGGTVLTIAWVGFLLPLSEVRLDVGRFRASAASEAVFASWCTIQSPIATGPSTYACFTGDGLMPGFVGGYSGGYNDPDAGLDIESCESYKESSPGKYVVVPTPCEPVALCTTSVSGGGSGSLSNIAICSCNATGCAIGDIPRDIQLDVALEDNQQTMTGTLAFGGANHTVRLKRQ